MLLHFLATDSIFLIYSFLLYCLLFRNHLRKANKKDSRSKLPLFTQFYSLKETINCYFLEKTQK